MLKEREDSNTATRVRGLIGRIVDGLLFMVRDGKRAGDKTLRHSGCIRSFDEIELRDREGGGVDAEGTDDGVDVVLFQE